MEQKSLLGNANVGLATAAPADDDEQPLDLRYSVRALHALIVPVVTCMLLTALFVARYSVVGDANIDTGFNNLLVFDDNSGGGGGGGGGGDVFDPAATTSNEWFMTKDDALVDGDDDDDAVAAAAENTIDELVLAWHALVNSLVFVAAVAGSTIVLLLLYACRLQRLIQLWMLFSVLSLLTFSGSFMFERMITSDGLIVDGYSYYLFLYNFSVVGVAAIFWTAAPELLKHAYLVVISIIMAFLLYLFPPWTTWMLVVSLSVYDLFAVLTPCGPLKIIIAMSKKRAAEGEAFPILVYETTPAVDPSSSSSSSSSLLSSSSSSSLQCDESASLLRLSARAAADSDSTDCNTVLDGALALQVND
jgi:hypothetical protein